MTIHDQKKSMDIGARVKIILVGSIKLNVATHYLFDSNNIVVKL